MISELESASVDLFVQHLHFWENMEFPILQVSVSTALDDNKYEILKAVDRVVLKYKVVTTEHWVRVQIPGDIAQFLGVKSSIVFSRTFVYPGGRGFMALARKMRQFVFAVRTGFSVRYWQIDLKTGSVTDYQKKKLGIIN